MNISNQYFNILKTNNYKNQWFKLQLSTAQARGQNKLQHPQDLLKMLYINERPTGHKQQLLDGRMVEYKGKLILTEIFPSEQKHDI